MIYELKVGLKTIKQEGFVSLFRKIISYFCQMASSVRFSMLRKPHGRPAEEVVDFSFKAADGLIYPGQVRSEFVQLSKLVEQRKPKVVVEIGTANGGTLSAWCALADPEATIISIDLPGGIHGGGYAYWRKFIYRQFAQPRQKLCLLRADSHLAQTRAQLEHLLSAQAIEFLFIDGDHTYEGVKADFEMYTPLVRRGGLVILHDICEHPPIMNSHVDKFWAEVKSRFKGTEIIENPNQGGFGIGVIEF